VTLIARYILLWLLASPADVERLRASAPAYLTTESARVHLAASKAAGAEHGVDDELMRRIAWHESRFTIDAVTPEPGDRVSCGVMTPEPVARCGLETTSALAGYDAGARHLALWTRLVGRRDALLAYAGGRALVRICRAEPSDARCDVSLALSLGQYGRRTSREPHTALLESRPRS
jgi:soluble lytic murein transglycosylase-like protein